VFADEDAFGALGSLKRPDGLGPVKYLGSGEIDVMQFPFAV
jgi:hypothetical protein